MLENIIVILLVIGLSYIFRQNSNDTFNTQMLFILLTLGGIIFYKIIYLQNCVKDKEMFVVDREPFQNNLNNVLNTFANGSIDTSNQIDYEANKEKITNLEQIVEELKSNYETSEQQKDILGNKGMTVNDLGVNSMNELEKIEREINGLIEDVGNNNKTEYKKIPVYNSCIIEANGDKSSTELDHTHPNTMGTLTKEEIAKIEENVKVIEKKKELLTQYDTILKNIKGPINNLLEGTLNIELP
jgi:hypothetical protein